MVAYLGVLTGPVSPELRAQFGLMEGFGLQIVEVMPDSPASQAGLKEHDLLISFDDQKLVNTDQLQALVRSRKKDETVVLSLISGGQQKQLSLKIGERVTQVMPERPRGGFMPMMPPWSGSWNPGAGQMQEWQQKMDKYQREMREYQQQVQKWALEGRVGSFPLLSLMVLIRGRADVTVSVKIAVQTLTAANVGQMGSLMMKGVVPYFPQARPVARRLVITFSVLKRASIMKVPASPAAMKAASTACGKMAIV